MRIVMLLIVVVIVGITLVQQQFPLSLFRPFSNRSILVIIEYKKRKTKYPLSVQRRLMTYIIKIP